jgi:hypothetical protein
MFLYDDRIYRDISVYREYVGSMFHKRLFEQNIVGINGIVGELVKFA